MKIGKMEKQFNQTPHPYCEYQMHSYNHELINNFLPEAESNIYNQQGYYESPLQTDHQPIFDDYDDTNIEKLQAEFQEDLQINSYDKNFKSDEERDCFSIKCQPEKQDDYSITKNAKIIENDILQVESTIPEERSKCCEESLYEQNNFSQANSLNIYEIFNNSESDCYFDQENYQNSQDISVSLQHLCYQNVQPSCYILGQKSSYQVSNFENQSNRDENCNNQQHQYQTQQNLPKLIQLKNNQELSPNISGTESPINKILNQYLTLPQTIDLKTIQDNVDLVCSILSPYFTKSKPPYFIEFRKLNQKMNDNLILRVIDYIRRPVVEYYKSLGKARIASQEYVNRCNHCMCGLNEQFTRLSSLHNHIHRSHNSTPVWVWAVKVNKKVGPPKKDNPNQNPSIQKTKEKFSDKIFTYCKLDYQKQLFYQNVSKQPKILERNIKLALK